MLCLILKVKAFYHISMGISESVSEYMLTIRTSVKIRITYIRSWFVPKLIISKTRI